MTWTARSRGAALAAMTAIGCAPGKAGTDSESGTTGATETETSGTTGATTGTSEDPTGATTGTSEDPTGSSTGAGVECGPHGEVLADVTVAWGIPLDPCDEEICVQTREAMCTVSEIAGVEITLECMHAGLGVATDVVSAALDPPGAIDLEVGAAVSLLYEDASFFEGGGSETLRITDAAGLVLGAVSGALAGQLSGDPMWGNEKLTPAVDPLAGAVANAGCTDDPARNVVTLDDGAASVSVQSGEAGVLTGGANWQVVVEEAWRLPTTDYDEEALDVAVMRVKP